MVSEWSKEHDWKSCIRQRIESSNLSRSASDNFRRKNIISQRHLIEPTAAEIDQRKLVVARILEFIAANQTIKLPPFDPLLDRPSDRFALQSVGIEPNPFGGICGAYRYQFEGEEDLLHLIVTRNDDGPLSPQEGQTVAGFLLEGVSPALIWLRPGEYSQHFYVGHDELTVNLVR